MCVVSGPVHKTGRHLRRGFTAIAAVVCGVSGLNGEPNSLESVINIDPTPSWVESAEWQFPTEEPKGAAAQIILFDQQDKLAANGGDYYNHMVVKLLSQEAVAKYAQQTVQVSPEFSEVTWHTLTVYRDGKTYDRLSATEFKKLQREPGLEAQLLTGEITYAAVLGDIRVGDVLEVANTRHYSNPLLAGHTTATHYLGDAYPVLRERVIIHIPHTLGEAIATFDVPEGTSGLPDSLFRQARLRLALSKTSTESEKVIRWEGLSLPAIEFDPVMPGRAYPYWPTLRISTFTSWSDVAQWAGPLFASPTRLPEPVAELVEKWKKEGNESDRLDKAVHWVEDDIRYFALDLGQHTIKPRPLDDVCSTRFGDCKDKALLLVSILRALGFEAWPALTNTYWRDRLNDISPFPGAFNHAIVAYTYKGRVKWIDPTITRQGGAPGEWAIPPHRTALIIRPGEDRLSQVENQARAEPDTMVLDHITVDPKSGDALMTTEVRLTGLQADYYRPSLSALSSAERSKGWFNFISLFYRRVEETQEPVFTDDSGSNTIVIKAQYKIPEFVSHEGDRTYVGVYGYLLRTLVDPMVSRRRHWPFALWSDRSLRHRIEVELPFSVDVAQLPELIRTPGLEYIIERGASGHRLVVQHDLKINADMVPATEMNQFCDNVQEILAALSTVIFKAPAAPANLDASTANTPTKSKSP